MARIIPYLVILGLVVPIALLGCEVEGDDDDDAGGDDDTGDDDAAPNEFGPENSWWHALEDDIPEGLAGTGYSAGDIAHDWTLLDQEGNQVQLYQFFGKVIVLDLFTGW